jgi:aspartyl-tRNA(Asn)/glutamyl-tRNA(Gln) amidotransferase subunit A
MTATLESLADALNTGEITSVALVDACLARIDESSGEGARAFVSVAHDIARQVARAMDTLRATGTVPSRYAGIPISIKDLFDIRGEVTRAGSMVLADAMPAAQDAVAVARLKAAGFIVIGRTNMTEFAFSGVGINPHYGTPLCVWDRAQRRVPGGSTSGGAIALTDGMAHGSLGTDTGGSCRIPAAFNGLVGYKPTARRVSTEGAFPLSTTLDSVGPIARSVACCATLDNVVSGAPLTPFRARHVRGLRILVPQAYVLNDLDETIAAAFETALKTLADAGATISRVACPEIDAIPAANAKGGFAAPESLTTHGNLIAIHRGLYDTRVLSRIERGFEQSASDYITLTRTRARLIAAFNERMQDYDVLAYPTVPIVPPLIAAFDRDEDFARLNMLILRNPSVINMLDGCAISLPMTRAHAAPGGLMLSAPGGRDRELLAIAAGVETALA